MFISVSGFSSSTTLMRHTKGSLPSALGSVSRFVQFSEVKYRIGLCLLYREHNIDQFTSQLLTEKSNKRACWNGWKAGDGVEEFLRRCGIADDVFLCA